MFFGDTTEVVKVKRAFLVPAFMDAEEFTVFNSDQRTAAIRTY